jgi:hypothetical protein
MEVVRNEQDELKSIVYEVPYQPIIEEQKVEELLID